MFRIALALVWTAAAFGSQTSAIGLADGALSITWITPSTFHYCRTWGEEKCTPPGAAAGEEVKVTSADAGGRLRLASEFVVVSVTRADGRLQVFNSRGALLFDEPSPAARTADAIVAERAAGADEAFFGLGVRGDESADARGRVLPNAGPFLVSSAGYGIHHVGPGSYTFDLAATRTDRWQVTIRGAQRIEYYFYFGPGYKAVLEEHRTIAEPSGTSSFGILNRDGLPRGAEVAGAGSKGTWETLAEAVRQLVHASLSGVVQPVFDLAPYRDGDDALYRRAAQVAMVAPLICDAPGGTLPTAQARARAELAEWRRRITPFLLTYVQEIRDQGYPVLHPLAMQYPGDAEGLRLTGQFLVGDELLAAPIVTPGNHRRVYFPMGNWTDLRTNRVYPGRKWAEIESPPEAIPLFLRNGSILPLESATPGGPLALHYTPRLAAEFFLYEPDTSEYGQAHASPALDRMRLEIYSRKTREYEWVVHHLPEVREVLQEESVLNPVEDRGALAPGRWFYDKERGNLHVVVAAAAGETRVTHIAFP